MHFMTGKIYYIALLTLLFLSCHRATKNELKNQLLPNDQEEILAVSKHISFSIDKFSFQLDSLLGIFEENKFSFNYKSDTIDTKIPNAELSEFRNGLFRSLYSENLESVKVHIYSVPKTKKILRIYLIEAEYTDSIKSKEKIEILKKESQSSSPIDDSDSRMLTGLTMTNDFLTRQGNKIYWLNIACQYSKSEYYTFIQCFKANLNNYNKSDTIICFCGGECKF
jgi:hypothetical protein